MMQDQPRLSICALIRSCDYQTLDQTTYVLDFVMGILGLMKNLSLSALGNVISALVDGKSKYIPYRDSLKAHASAPIITGREHKDTDDSLHQSS